MNLKIGFGSPDVYHQLRGKGLSDALLKQLDADKKALDRLMKRGLLSYAETNRIRKRIETKIDKAILDNLPF